MSTGRPQMASGKGTWYLEKRRRFGWEYVIRDSSGHLDGWYAGCRWLKRETISLGHGTQDDLWRSLSWAWKLQTTDTRARYFDMRTSRQPNGPTLALTVRSLAATARDTQLLILTACTVLLLSETMPSIQGSG